MRGPNNEEPIEQNLDAKLTGFKSMRKTSYSTSSSCLHSREFKSNHADFYLFTLHVVSGPVKSKKRMQPQDHTWCAQSQNRRFSKMHLVLYVYNCHNCPKYPKSRTTQFALLHFLGNGKTWKNMLLIYKQTKPVPSEDQPRSHRTLVHNHDLRAGCDKCT